MENYDNWKLENGHDEEKESFGETISICGENSDDYNMFESELEELLQKYGYKRER